MARKAERGRRKEEGMLPHAAAVHPRRWSCRVHSSAFRYSPAAFLLLLCFLALPLPALETTDTLAPSAAAAVRKGVESIVRKQHPDGSWQGGTGVSSTCVLALMAQGHIPGSGEYGPQVGKALQYLLRQQQPDGFIFAAGSSGGPMYHHGLATLALGEAWGQTGDRRIRDGLRKAIDLICSTQNQEGGWRYQPKVADADLSVTVMQLMALRAAKDAGMDVSKEVIDAGIEYVKRCHNSKGAGKDGGFAYTAHGPSGWARAGAGITSLQVAGNYRANEVTEGIDYIMQFKPVGEKEPENEQFYYYGIYYCTMGLYQGQALGAVGKRNWQKFYAAVVRDLCARQKPDGTWDGGNGSYPTAMAVLCLTIPYRYLPIYQR